jgi:hypothetical protein
MPALFGSFRPGSGIKGTSGLCPSFYKETYQTSMLRRLASVYRYREDQQFDIFRTHALCGYDPYKLNFQMLCLLLTSERLERY